MQRRRHGKDADFPGIHFAIFELIIAGLTYLTKQALQISMAYTFNLTKRSFYVRFVLTQ
ncbi:hypothetical protein [Lelliottia amnigena]|uniref:hypothetical protein n=1 Tax=Lelliottia amnigena TaxID=61646 RepID=UPI003BA2819A